MAVKVISTGKDGFHGTDEDGRRHGLPWDAVVGHKARMLHHYQVVDQGADGALLQDDAGRRRYLAGVLPDAEPDTKPDTKPDDPLSGGLDRLAKSAAPATVHRNGETSMAKASTPAGLLPAVIPKDSDMAPVVLFLKAMGTPVANRPGLALKRVTDKGGRQTQRWSKTGADVPGPNKPAAKPDAPAPMKHGDVVGFRHGDVQGQGKIVASGQDGVTVHDGEREHQVRHEHLAGPAKAAEGDAPPPASGTAKPAAGDKPGASGAGPGQGGAGGGAGDGGDGPVDPAKFDAHSYAAQHNDPHVTPDQILAQFPPDTADKIADAMAKLSGQPQTIETYKKGEDYTPERRELHAKIIGTFLSAERRAAARPAPGAKPTFTILGGRGGSGKGWFKNKVYDPDKAIVLDADEIKHMLPEFEGWNAATVHEESGDLFDEITRLAQDLRLNVVHDATMKTAKKAVTLVQGFKDDEYHVEAHYMYLPPQEAAKRAVDRFLGPTKRFVPPGVVLGNTTNESSFDQVKSLADVWSFRDNNVSKGQQPRVISESKRDEADTGQPGRDGLPPAGTDDGRDGAGGSGKGGSGDAGKDPLGKALRPEAILQAARGGVTRRPALPAGPILFLKAVIPDQAQAGLFDQRVQVAGHATAHGTYVAPYQATRRKAAAAAPAPAADWRDHDDFHARTQARMKTLTHEQLRYIQRDAGEASRAADTFGGSKAGQYADESHYAGMEMTARSEAQRKAAEAADAKAAGKPAVAPMKEHDAMGVAMAARRWNAARRGISAVPSEGAGLSHYMHATGQRFTDAEQDSIIAQWRKLDGAVTTRDPTTMPGAPELVPTSHGLPEGSAYLEGKGPLGSGRWTVRTPGIQHTPPYSANKGEAITAAQAWHRNRNALATARVDDARMDASIAAKVLAGGEVTRSDLMNLRLPAARKATFEELSPIVQRLFGVSARKVREAMGGSLVVARTWSGAPVDMALPAEAFKEVARFLDQQAAAPAKPVLKVGDKVTWEGDYRTLTGSVLGVYGERLYVRLNGGGSSMQVDADKARKTGTGTPLHGTGRDALEDAVSNLANGSPERQVAQNLLAEFTGGNSKISIEALVYLTHASAADVWRMVSSIAKDVSEPHNGGIVRRAAHQHVMARAAAR